MVGPFGTFIVPCGRYEVCSDITIFMDLVEGGGRTCYNTKIWRKSNQQNKKGYSDKRKTLGSSRSLAFSRLKIVTKLEVVWLLYKSTKRFFLFKEMGNYMENNCWSTLLGWVGQYFGPFAHNILKLVPRKPTKERMRHHCSPFLLLYEAGNWPRRIQNILCTTLVLGGSLSSSDLLL